LIFEQSSSPDTMKSLLGKSSRGDKTPLELFLAGVAQWDVQVIRLVQAA
jgi:hypothetical protein